MRASIAVSRTPDGLATHLELSWPTTGILQESLSIRAGCLGDTRV